MDPHPAVVQTPCSADAACRLVVRQEKSLAEILHFVVGGLEVGQQAVVMAAPGCLKEIALGIGDAGIRPDALLRNGRLVFLPAPDCIALFSKPETVLQRGPLRRNGSLVRWVSDWSWAYGNGARNEKVLTYQHQVHQFVRSLTSLSMCTVHCEKLERAGLLAVLADHRRALKPQA